MNKVNALSWQFRFAIILVVLVSWSAAGGSAHAAEPKLQVITEIAPPASFIDTDGNLTGLAVEIIQAIQQEIGDHTEIQVMPWARGYQELTTNSNVALFSTTRTPARENLFQWVGPLFTTRWIIYARKDSGLRITSLEDAKSIKRIGVYRDDARAHQCYPLFGSDPERVSRKIGYRP
ncbi:MAG: transporter substrate-binding domain-containing protein [Pseudodesulfovibrio sp.]